MIHLVRAFRTGLVALAAGHAIAAAAPGLTFAGIFGDHAVVQRGRPIAVWGKAAPHAAVDVQLGGASARTSGSTRADGTGAWRIQLPALEAGGPYVLRASAGGAATTLDDIMIGDVLLCSGQSNMELAVANATNAPNDVPFSANPAIRFANVKQDSAAVRKDEFATAPRWQVAGPDTTGQASAVCYYMARALQRKYQIPVGFVDATWGGTTIQGWLSGPALRTLADYRPALDVVDLYGTDPEAGRRAEERRLEAWWDRTDPQARAQRTWSRPGFDDKGWPELTADGNWNAAAAESLRQHRGVVWFRTTVDLTAAQAAAVTHLDLGQVAAADTTWINGTRVGAGTTWWMGRHYPVPAGLLKPGRNVIALRVLGDDNGGGLVNPPAARALRTADGGAIPLPAGWKYRIGSRLAAAQPAAPWEPFTSLTTLYNGMIAPLRGYGFKLVAWYQGEANAGAAQEYRTLLPLLFADWRKTFGQPDLPFLVAQLASFGSVSTAPGRSSWAELRHAQSDTVAHDPHAGLAVTFDFGDRSDIHPSQKTIVGERLARAARAVAYGEDIVPGSPRALAATRVGADILVHFSHAAGGLRTYSSDTAIGFEVCERSACRYARATVEGDTVRLHGAATPGATSVRYAWSDAPFVNLFSADDLPADGFELDLH